MIEELGEWIDDAFGRFEDPNFERPIPNGKVSSPPRRGSSQSTPKKPAPSPYTTETETDDVGIMFVPKKYQKLSPPASGDDSKAAPILSPTETSSEGETLHDADHLDLVLGLVDGYEVPNSDETDGYNKPPVGARPSGQTISETEMIRRRRLLDAHLKTSNSR